MRGEAMGDGSYPFLRLTIDGKDVELFWEQQKPTLTLAGLTFLGHEFEGKVPDIDFHVPGEPGNVITLEGFTDDTKVHSPFTQYLRFCNSPAPRDPDLFHFV